MKHLLIRFNQSTGKIDTTLSNDYSDAMLRIWALKNTTPSKETVIINYNGVVVYRVSGRRDNLPEIEDAEALNGLKCAKIGIPTQVVQNILDEE